MASVKVVWNYAKSEDDSNRDACTSLRRTGKSMLDFIWASPLLLVIRGRPTKQRAVPSGISLRLSRNLFTGSPETLSQSVASGNRTHTSVWTRKPSHVLSYEMRISAEFLLRGRRNLIPYRPRAFSGSSSAKPGDFFLLSNNSYLDTQRKIKLPRLLWLH